MILDSVRKLMFHIWILCFPVERSETFFAIYNGLQYLVTQSALSKTYKKGNRALLYLQKAMLMIFFLWPFVFSPWNFV